MSDIIVPPEVCDAVERLLNLYLVGGLKQSEEFRIGHALVNVAISAWPDSILMPAEIILPLPQEGKKQ